jgi:DNA polymerase-3 subunit beta
MPSDQFVKMLNQVKPAMSKDPARQNIKSINIDSKNNKLNLVSTDGYFMIIKTADIYTQDINEAIPDFTVKQIIKAFKSDELLIISLNKTNTISFLKIESNNTTLVLRLLDDEHPGYTKGLSLVGNEVVIVNKKQLIAITEEAKAITTDKHNSIIFNFENNILDIKVKEQDEIRYSNQMAIEGLVKLEIGFNAKQLLNILKSIDDDIITFKLRDSEGIVKIEADNFAGLIMPIRI